VPILQGWYFRFTLAFLLQYLLVVPHEMGHALTGRALGFSDIRILIGAGKPLFDFEWLGFHWLINRVPFGGLTYVRPGTQTPTRGEWLLFASSGLMVNTVFAIGAWLLLPNNSILNMQPISPGMDLLKIFLWANLLVIAENGLPRSVQTPLAFLRTMANTFLTRSSIGTSHRFRKAIQFLCGRCGRLGSLNS
jgi:hypothetical protein